MRLPKDKLIDRQLTMFPPEDIDLKPLAARYYTGDFFEALTAAVTKGVRLRTDAMADICPDVRLRENLFIEVKSIGKNGSVIFYETRRDVAERFVEESDMVLFLWHHGASVDENMTLSGLHHSLASGIKSLTVIDWRSFANLLTGRPMREFFKTGKRRNGWTLPMRMIHSSCCTLCGEVETDLIVCGQTVAGAVPLYCSHAWMRSLVENEL